MSENNFNTGLNVKSVLIKLNLFDLAKKYLTYYNLFNHLSLEYKNRNKAVKDSIKNIFHFHVPSLSQSKGLQYKELFSKVDISISDEGFIFFLDKYKSLGNFNFTLNNLSVDYSKILNNSLNQLKSTYENKNDEYSLNQKYLLEGIEIVIDKVIGELKSSNRKDKDKFIEYFNNIKYLPVSGFEEALQRILFFNQLFWQTGHKLNGFGRLDRVLDEIYHKDVISKNDSLNLIKDFLKAGHRYYYSKSAVLSGDTGQIIVLGGLETDNSYFCNDLSYLFIEALKELQLPDPKLILRYSNNAPRDLLKLGLECIETGVGSPLLSNDHVIIDKLINFGYEKEDAYNYVVSACWEPAPIGKSFEMNNVNCLVFLNPLNDLLDNEDLNDFKNFDSFLMKYKEYLKTYIDNVTTQVNGLNWETDPLVSLFIEGCDENLKDISQGAAFYNNYGLTSVSLSNTINSLLNIKSLVFDNSKLTLDELNNRRKNNFEDVEILEILKNQPLKFGMDDEQVLTLANEIVDYTNEVIKSKNTKYGGKFKFGLSAPSYITRSDVDASLDGRKNNEPFNVHISLDDNKDYTEIMRFASKLDYSESRFNGNVVDLMVTPDFIEKNFEKFLDYLILSLDMGVFQIQLNVVDSKTLIDAKENPEKYPNLIVRVWGFSAYFKDLPESYQDVLIKRAIQNESR
jgi:formate C-acetyltransferase